MGASIAYVEITSKDPARIAGFYGKLFDWTISDGPTPDYSMIDTGAGDDGVSGGVGPVQGPDDPGGITVYVKVDDLQATLDRAEALGGRTVVPPSDLPGDYGTFAVFSDPDGNSVGLWA
jgi:uncharacterized protein